MTFTNSGQNPRTCNQAQADRILDKFVEKGGNFIDTADVYSNGESEKIIGNWLKTQDRSKIILATKLGSHGINGNINTPGLSRHNILRSVEASLERLETPYIDLLYTHVWDDGTPLEETLETLGWLVQQGKVRYIGCSNVTGWQLQLAAIMGKQPNLGRYVVLQQQYSLLCREVEWEVTPVAEREGISILPWSPLKGGWLSGKMKRNEDNAPVGSRVHAQTEDGVKNQSGPNWLDLASRDQTWSILEELKNVAERNKKTVAQVATRWLLEKKNVPSVVIGVKNLEQLEDNLGSVGWKMSVEDLEQLDEVSKLPEPYPYEMVNRLNKNRKR
eukprot:GFUD01001860.1.p1 GENE.GFUD01001860.1~~GFUD01001860.1.p1  ORF type:complete len:362 (+),score=71.11 GFUD01001860.1:97-1086(+)